jgi:hypothetical protein
MANNLGDAYRDAGQNAKTVQLLEPLLAVAQAHLGKEDGETLYMANNLGVAYADTDQSAKAEPVLVEHVALLRKRHGTESTQLAGALALLCSIQLRQEKYTAAELTAREALAIREKKESEDWRTFNTKSMLGGSLLGQKKYAEAEPLLLAGYDGMRAREANIPAHGKIRLIESLERLVHLYEATGKKDAAREWRKKWDAANSADSKPKW